MKKITLLTLLTTFVFMSGHTQVVKNFDAMATWNGYMAWTGPSGDGGGVWAVPDLVALLDTGANTATLKPNRVNDTSSYWFTNPTDFYGEKTMTANFYVEDASLISTNFNFIGNISGFTLNAGYTVNAFIKILNSSYVAIFETYQPITGTGDFILNYDGATTGGFVAQYGFVTVGSNVNPGATYDAQYNALGSVVATAQTLSVRENFVNQLKVYPNPAVNEWTISAKDISISNINVFDVLGKNVITLSPNANKATINGTGLKSGIYFAKINTDKGTSSIKLIKQ